MSFGLRPTAHLPSPLAADALLDRFERMLADRDCPCEGNVLGRHVTLKVHAAERHFWSPWLNIEIEPAPSGGSILHARFSPHPNIWTMVALSYLALSVVFMIGACFGLAQWWIQRPPTALWAMPLAVLVSAALWVISQIGQKLAAAEMEMLDREMRRVAEPLDQGGRTPDETPCERLHELEQHRSPASEPP